MRASFSGSAGRLSERPRATAPHARPVRPALLVERRDALGPVARERGRPPGARPRCPGRSPGRRPAPAATPAWRCVLPPASWPRSSPRAASAASRSVPAATRRSTRPSRSASADVDPAAGEDRGRRPARRPTRRTSSWVPPPPGITPTVTSGSPSTAVSSHDDQVAGQRELEPAAEREAVHRRDGRARAGRGRRRTPPGSAAAAPSGRRR